MTDIIAQLEVLSRESGCLVDLSSLLNMSTCPKIDLKVSMGHTVKENDDLIYIVPTKVSCLRQLEREGFARQRLNSSRSPSLRRSATRATRSPRRCARGIMSPWTWDSSSGSTS